MRRILWVAIVGLLSGCAQQSHVKLYSGSELPRTQVVVVEIPSTLEVLDINGQEVPLANSSFGTANKTLHLQPGEYRINAYYKNGFDIGGGLSHEIVRTRSALYRLNGRAGDVWKLEYDEPANLQEARAMKDSFAGWSTNQRTGERIETQVGAEPTSAVNQLLVGSSTSYTQSTVEPLNGAQAAAASAAVPVPSRAAVPSQTLPHSDATLNTLQQLWLMLSPESRKAFLEWAKQ
ncbi:MULTISPECIES: DUF2057 family protein [Pseudomonadaceae]|jgi:uncharacterized protein|uniref:DUF2057 family protein n=1 Tax=Pseudomonadaceae TaxID=135621 RepID=UPI0018795520|nr:MULTISPECIES: DUF2057 family protein [Pseudomonadaceae]MBE7374798.1 DUF2057 family protein [Pseudomonas lopnurensis]MDH1540446.1 DUF2057 domain-containing protein [Stutzerimonas stutzeri]